MAQADAVGITRDDIDARLRFHPETEILEVDFSDLSLATTAEVNTLYDRIEERIVDSGESKWFFLINYHNTRIDPVAWLTYSRRGKALNLAFSQGSVRFDPSEETRRQIERAAGTDAFDANLHNTREGALRRIAELPSQRVRRTVLEPSYSTDEIAQRISFDPDTQIMEIDFEGFTFHHGRDADDVYDFIEARIRESDQKWFFLVNYNGCKIMPAAWPEYARRGKELNVAASLGSVRYAAGSETEADIRARAESQGFRPNIRNTREEALERIEEMRAELMHGAAPS